VEELEDSFLRRAAHWVDPAAKLGTPKAFDPLITDPKRNTRRPRSELMECGPAILKIVLEFDKA